MELRALDERVGRASWRGFCWGAGLGSIMGSLMADVVPEFPRFVLHAPSAFDLAVTYSGAALSQLSIMAACAWAGACVVGSWVRWVNPRTQAFDC